MTGSEIAQIITSVSALVAAIGSTLALVQSSRNGQKVVKIAADVHTIEKATNSMQTALIASTAKASLAEGTAAGLEQGRNEDRPRHDDPPVKVEIVKIPQIPELKKGD